MKFKVTYEARHDMTKDVFYPKSHIVEAESEGPAIRATEEFLKKKGYDLRFCLDVRLAKDDGTESVGGGPVRRTVVSDKDA